MKEPSDGRKRGRWKRGDASRWAVTQAISRHGTKKNREKYWQRETEGEKNIFIVFDGAKNTLSKGPTHREECQTTGIPFNIRVG